MRSTRPGGSGNKLASLLKKKNTEKKKKNTIAFGGGESNHGCGRNRTKECLHIFL